MKKVFIDCGGHIGESITEFKKSSEYDKRFLLYSFEPVPHLAKLYKDWKDIVYSDKAVWIEDGEVEFYIDRTHNQAFGSTLKKEKTSGKLDKENPTKFKSIDFDKWVKHTFNKDDYIVLKMDIEGAEYDVLSKMIDGGSIHYINKAYIEFHWAKLGMQKSQHDILIKRLKSIKSFALCPEMHKHFQEIANE